MCLRLCEPDHGVASSAAKSARSRLNDSSTGGIESSSLGESAIFLLPSFRVRNSLLRFRSIRFLGCGCFGSGFLCILVLLLGYCSCGFRFHPPCKPEDSPVSFACTADMPLSGNVSCYREPAPSCHLPYRWSPRRQRLQRGASRE